MHGVAEYWLVDPAAETVWVHRLRNGEPVVAHTFASGDTLCSPLLPGFALDGLGAFQRHRGQPREECIELGVHDARPVLHGAYDTRWTAFTLPIGRRSRSRLDGVHAPDWTATGAIPFDRRAARRPALDIAGQTPTMG